MAAHRKDDKTATIAKMRADRVRICDIASQFSMSRQAVHYHLRKHKTLEALKEPADTVNESLDSATLAE